MNALERRQEERILCVLGVGRINGQPCPDTYLTDISSIGAQLETGYSLAIGDSVDFDLSQAAETPEEKETYVFAGQVVWIKESEPARKRYRIGLSFFTPFNETNKILAKFRYRLV
jgi:Tfp pilus assembly protein PilZ